MKKSFLVLMTLFLLGSANSMVYGFIRPIFLRPVFIQFEPNPPIINPTSLNNPLPCDIEAYQTEDGIEIIVNDVSLSGFYQISVFDNSLDRVYNTSVLFYDGASAFISTDHWKEDTYYLQIIIPGGWLEGEFEIED